MSRCTLMYENLDTRQMERVVQMLGFALDEECRLWRELEIPEILVPGVGPTVDYSAAVVNGLAFVATDEAIRELIMVRMALGSTMVDVRPYGCLCIDIGSGESAFKASRLYGVLDRDLMKGVDLYALPHCSTPSSTPALVASAVGQSDPSGGWGCTALLAVLFTLGCCLISLLVLLGRALAGQ